jgi:hypothetical protein
MPDRVPNEAEPAAKRALGCGCATVIAGALLFVCGAVVAVSAGLLSLVGVALITRWVAVPFVILHSAMLVVALRILRRARAGGDVASAKLAARARNLNLAGAIAAALIALFVPPALEAVADAAIKAMSAPH